MVEILTKAAVPRGGSKIDVRRGEDPEIDHLGAGAPETAHSPLFDNFQ